ncbi:UNVERIFIED_CONTAM: hypothetical protein PYX00_007267 [Menopon gallinae]|uniref:NADP-dependent oxidoreductase domain-containing protein n=1 Tax=Menopon gallinae TaxID=328185 RepID=A0AAW2HI98_9NEOP
MAAVPKITLNNGKQMPVLGLGTYTASPQEMMKIVKAAIDCGYRHFDTAFLYQTEKYLGQAVRDKIAEGVIKREDVFIVSKLWCTYHRPDLVIEGCKKTLENLGLDYVDLFLIHWPSSFQPVDEIKGYKEPGEGVSILDCPQFFPLGENNEIIPGETDFVETWKSMEKCVDMGMAASIGISNFNSEQIDRLLKSARIKPVTNQVEVNPYLNQKKLIDFCAKRDIWITAYGPLGLQIPMNDSGIPRLVENPKIVALAKEVNKTPAQVILRYLIQSKTIPIPKTSNVARLSENISVFDFTLNDAQMAIMDSLDCNRRLCVIPGTQKHKNYPFSIDF